MMVCAVSTRLLTTETLLAHPIPPSYIHCSLCDARCPEPCEPVHNFRSGARHLHCLWYNTQAFAKNKQDQRIEFLVTCFCIFGGQ